MLSVCPYASEIEIDQAEAGITATWVIKLQHADAALLGVLSRGGIQAIITLSSHFSDS